MIASLEPYPVMKDSGVQWLGQVPEHWDILPNRAIFIEVKDRKHPEEQMLSVTITRGVIPQQALLADSSKKDGSNIDKSAYKLVQPGDVVYNKMRAWQGAVGASEYRGIVSPAYVVQRSREGANPRYFHYLLRTPAFAKEAERWSYGITSDMWSLRPEHFKVIYSCLPSPAEQVAIVRFLDHYDRKIRRYIRAKQKLIKLLEEQKRAIIHRAVTAEFIERLPLNVLGLPQQVASLNGWSAVSVGHLCQKRWLTIQDGNHGELHPKSSEFVEGGIPFLMAKDVRPDRINFKGCAKISEARAMGLRIGFALPGDVLLTHKATIGQVSVVPKGIEWPFVMLSPQVTYYRPLCHELSAEYLALYFQSRIFQEQLKVLGLNQSTRPYIGLLEQRNLVVCFPSPERQREIVSQYESEGLSVHKGMEKAWEVIVHLREYSTRLIADVVTGKLDVRETAARLPDEPETEELEAGGVEADDVFDSEEAEVADAHVEEAEA